MGMIVDATLGLKGIRLKGQEAFRIGGSIQKFIDDEVLKGTEPYMPFRLGIATKSGRLYTRIGHGMLRWKTPYIRPIYRGYRYLSGGRKSKEFTYDKSTNSKAGKEWAETYKRENLNKLSTMVKRKVRQEFD